MSSGRLILFDFDGTLTHRDTLFEFIRFTKGNVRFVVGFIWLAPVLILLKLGLMHNQRAKEIVLEHFFSGESLENFNRHSLLFKAHVDGIIRDGAGKAIKDFLSGNARIVVVSASPENWVKPWCDSIGIECIATKLQSKDGRITGKIEGLNCYGEEKVRRIKEVVNLDDYKEVIAYGDTPSDYPMMKIAGRSFYRPFR